MDDREILVIEVARRGSTGGNVATVDWNTIRAEVTALLSRANITKLDAVPDVAASSPSNGQVLTWNGSNWVPTTPVNAVTGVTDSASVDLTLSSGNISAVVKYGGSGSATTAARSDHAHTTPSTVVATFGPGGYMSSGSRPLASTSVVLASGVTYLVQTRLNMQMRGADAGQCQYRMALTVDGSTHESPAGTNGFWCVQGVPDKTMWFYPRTIVGTGAAVSISAAVSYYGGGGFNTDAGEIEVTLIPNK